MPNTIIQDSSSTEKLNYLSEKFICFYGEYFSDSIFYIVKKLQKYGNCTHTNTHKKKKIAVFFFSVIKINVIASVKTKIQIGF